MADVVTTVTHRIKAGRFEFVVTNSAISCPDPVPSTTNLGGRGRGPLNLPDAISYAEGLNRAIELARKGLDS